MMQRIKFSSGTHKRYWISQYSKIQIPLPPLEIQKKIVEEIEGYQRKIEGNKRLIVEYEQKIRTIINEV
ncbi:MAG: hypothetical protein ACD_12C00546G0001 [uncultured bacterium]|nr:MAG: hypothetical protein ACD_12C00546G0001 [uncultured bacterium]